MTSTDTNQERNERDPQSVVAYRNPDRPGVLLCREHGEGWSGMTPLTSENLPDGGTCTYGKPSNNVCGRNVLIPVITAPTDEDLRSVAAVMHYGLTLCPNPADADAALNGHPAWANVEVGSDEETRLREAVVELVSGAADVSDWAVGLGADGLEPIPEHIALNADGKPFVRVLFAFVPDTDQDLRESLIYGIGQEIQRHL